MELKSMPSNIHGKPKWNSHSCRRGGAKRARETMNFTEAKEEDINRHFGWVEEALKGGKRRQVAYAGTLPPARRISVTLGF
jgi:hypothetical protein